MHYWIKIVNSDFERREGWNGKSKVNDRRSDFNLSNNGFSALGIGIENALSSPPLGLGKVILFSVKSTQDSGIRVSRRRHPVCRLISKAICIHSGSVFNSTWISEISQRCSQRAVHFQASSYRSSVASVWQCRSRYFGTQESQAAPFTSGM